MEVFTAVLFVAVLVINATSFFGSSKSSVDKLYDRTAVDTKFNRDITKNA